MANNTNFKYFDNKFIFTDEGRTALIAQNGGLRLAVLGVIFIQGLTPVEPDEMHETYRKLTYETLLSNDSILFGFKGISYQSTYNDKAKPVNDTLYSNALANPTKYLYGSRYIPSLGVEDKQGHYYGTYDFEYDKTSFLWDHEKNVSFAHMAIIGKQYSEVNDVSYNVNKTQEPVLIGLAQIAGNYNAETEIFRGGLQFLANQEDFMSYKVQIRFTLTDEDKDMSTDMNIEHIQDVIEAADKINLINNGLKTNETVKIVGNTRYPEGSNHHTIEEDLCLDNEGTIMSQRSFMVADAYNADDMENQFNTLGLVHIINKKDDDTRYKQQLIMTTVEQPESYAENEVTAYSVGMLLQANGEYMNGIYASSAAFANSAIAGTEAPIFKFNNIPEYDDKAVEIFGSDNKILGEETCDKVMFSKRNAIGQPANINQYGYNTLFASDENFIFEAGANTNNTLIKSNSNVIRSQANTNLLIGSDGNMVENGATVNTLIASDMNVINNGNTYNNVLIGTKESYFDNSNNMTIINGEGINAANQSNKTIIGKYNVPSNADIVIANGTSDTSRHNMFETYFTENQFRFYGNDNFMFVSNTGMLFNNGDAIYANTGISFNRGESTYQNNYIMMNYGSTVISLDFISVNRGYTQVNSTGLSVNNGKTQFGEFGINVDNGRSVYSTDGISLNYGKVSFTSAGMVYNNGNTFVNSAGFATTNGSYLTRYDNSGFAFGNNTVLASSGGLIMQSTGAAVYVGLSGTNNYNTVLTKDILKLANGNIVLARELTGTSPNSTYMTMWGNDKRASVVRPCGIEYYDYENHNNATLTAVGSKHAQFSVDVTYLCDNDDNYLIAFDNIRDDLNSSGWFKEMINGLCFGVNAINDIEYYLWSNGWMEANNIATSGQVGNYVSWGHFSDQLLVWATVPELYSNITININFYENTNKCKLLIPFIPIVASDKKVAPYVDLYIDTYDNKKDYGGTQIWAWNGYNNYNSAYTTHNAGGLGWSSVKDNVKHAHLRMRARTDNNTYMPNTMQAWRAVSVRT